jgi:hypothetical protein
MMSSIKMISIMGALVVLIALTGVVSAGSLLNYGYSGSSFDGNTVSLLSKMGTSNTGSFIKPSSLLYSVSVKGMGTQASFGDMSAFLRYSGNTSGNHISYSETSTASGLIYDFSKSMSVSF